MFEVVMCIYLLSTWVKITDFYPFIIIIYKLLIDAADLITKIIIRVRINKAKNKNAE
jgi:hypothetical protein